MQLKVVAKVAKSRGGFNIINLWCHKFIFQNLNKIQNVELVNFEEKWMHIKFYHF